MNPTPKKDSSTMPDLNALAASRFKPAIAQSNAAAQAAFDTLIGTGGFESLNEAGKASFRAFAVIDALVQFPNALALDPAIEEKWKGAMQACLDAVRDHKTLGIFDPSATGPTTDTAATAVATSKDPEVKNQAPTGTVGEMPVAVSATIPPKATKA